MMAARERRRPKAPDTRTCVCEPATVGTVTCGRCGCETLSAAPPGCSARCPVCGAQGARFEPFERALEWVPVPMFQTR